MIQKFVLGLLLCFMVQAYAQKDINNYKYVIVPEAFVFLNDNDQYQLNSLTKFLFEKYGFTAFLRGEELPKDARQNGCLALTADVLKQPGLFMTKLIVQLKDCNGKLVYATKEGKSREKDFKRAYHEALRDAFKDMKKINYSYEKRPVQVSQEIAEERKDSAISQPVVERSQDNTSVGTPVSVPVVKEKAEVSPKVVSHSEETRYSWNNQKFIFIKEGADFTLIQIQDGISSELGKISSTEKENLYMVKAGDYSGKGYFDAYGNFILERTNPVTNKIITDIFARE